MYFTGICESLRYIESGSGAYSICLPLSPKFSRPTSICMGPQHLVTSLLNTIVSCGKGLGQGEEELKDGSESVERGRDKREGSEDEDEREEQGILCAKKELMVTEKVI